MPALRTTTLDIAYAAHGPGDGEVVVLLHGFPYDTHCFDAVVPILVAAGLRVIVPSLRGYGATRFLAAETMRSGQQAALGQDLLDLLDGLGIARAALVGYDWGGRAACIVAALHPERVRCLVSGGGYAIQDIAAAAAPQAPAAEHRLWYQYYFHSPRGEAGLAANRVALARLLWTMWSPSWPFDETAFARSAAAFDNPDFVAVVVHSYRHRFGYAPGDPSLHALEQVLAEAPTIAVPSISLCGADDGVTPAPEAAQDAAHFTGWHERRLLSGIGHNLPLEAPEAVAAALLALLGR